MVANLVVEGIECALQEFDSACRVATIAAAADRNRELAESSKIPGLCLAGDQEFHEIRDRRQAVRARTTLSGGLVRHPREKSRGLRDPAGISVDRGNQPA